MTPSLIEASRRAFMASNGIDLHTPAREKRAAVQAYGEMVRSAMPNAYNQFTYTRPTGMPAPSTSPAGGVRPAAVAPGTWNAQTLPLGRPDLAAANYNVTLDNVREQFSRVWADRATEDGGSKQIIDKLTQWSSPEAILGRDPRADPNSGQWPLIRRALATGELDPRIRPEVLLRGMGVGLSETARHQQHKKTFWDSALGKIIKFGGPMLIPGPLGTIVRAAGTINSARNVLSGRGP